MPDKFRTERDHEDRARVRDEQLDIERHYDRLISQAEGDPALQEFWRMGRCQYREDVERGVTSREPVRAEYGFGGVP